MENNNLTNIEAIEEAQKNLKKKFEDLYSTVERISNNVINLKTEGGYSDTSADGTAEQLQVASSNMFNSMKNAREKLNEKFDNILNAWREYTIAADEQNRAEVNNIPANQ